MKGEKETFKEARQFEKQAVEQQLFDEKEREPQTLQIQKENTKKE